MPVLFGGGDEDERALERAVNRLRYAISRVAVQSSAGQRQKRGTMTVKFWRLRHREDRLAPSPFNRPFEPEQERHA